MRNFDLVVIGSGPAGQRAAIQAAKLKKTVLVIEAGRELGGVAINTGTIPSKALREAILRFGRPGSGFRTLEPGVREERLSELVAACREVVRAEVALVRSHFASNGIAVAYGEASFVEPNRIGIEGAHSNELVAAKNVLIATGSAAARPSHIPLDGTTVITADDLVELARLPRSIMIVGGGVIGTEYAAMFSALGSRVTLIEGRGRLLDFLDVEIGEALQYHLRQSGISLRLGEQVVGIAKNGVVTATLASGKKIEADALLYAVGREGQTAKLELQQANLLADDRGRLRVDDCFRTAEPNIYAAGDVIGFPALAATAMEQGRLAAHHMFEASIPAAARLVPYGIYTIPEISMVGRTEEQLTNENIPYESGVANYREIARGQLIGDTAGMLKLLIHQETHQLLGVHAIGTQATELIHIGQAVMSYGGTAEYFVDTVFNYPTLAECYKAAALNGLNKLRNR